MRHQYEYDLCVGMAGAAFIAKQTKYMKVYTSISFLFMVATFTLYNYHEQ